MRDAAEGVERNQLGRVGELQERIQGGLDGVIDRLSKRGPLSQNGSAQSPDSLSQLVPLILELVRRQAAVALGTEELSRIRTRQDGPLRPLQLEAVRQLALDQRELVQETVSLEMFVEAAEVFAFGLRSASHEMLRAAVRLEQGVADRDTIAAQAAALRKLRGLHEALQQDGRDPDAEPAGPPSQRPQESASTKLQLSELRLLKAMQLEINRRTTELDAQRDRSGSLPLESRRELADLMTEQGSLSAIVLKLSREAE